MIKSIKTVYKEIQFRSRLEARWAIFFDCLGLSYQYEPKKITIENGVYIPDFFLPLLGTWIEIKPVVPIPDELRKARELHKVTGQDVVILYGGTLLISPQMPDSIRGVVYPDKRVPTIPHDGWAGPTYNAARALKLIRDTIIKEELRKFINQKSDIYPVLSNPAQLNESIIVVDVPTIEGALSEARKYRFTEAIAV